MNATIIILIILVAILLIFSIISVVKISKLNSSKTDTSSLEEKLSDIKVSTNETINNALKTYGDTISKMQETTSETQSQNLRNLTTEFEQMRQLNEEQLSKLNKDIGEIKGFSSGVADLKKLFSNIKNAGIIGEAELSNLLKSMLAPNQYAENKDTVPGSGERVEFAIKLPGDQPGSVIYLPIDSKFPSSKYQDLLNAYDEGNKDAIRGCQSKLQTQIRKDARNIHEKYIQVPYTTKFGILFLPSEGLFAEAVKLNDFDAIQKDLDIIIAGPTTLASILYSFQMGFKTLALQKNADDVWEILGKIKKQFQEFQQTLLKTQEALDSASDNLNALVTTRMNKMNAALKSVEEVEIAEDENFLPSEHSDADYND